MNFRSFRRFFQGNNQPARRQLRKRPGGRQSTANLQIEALEPRAMMSVLPTATVVDKSQLDAFSSSNPVFGPSVVMDPVNPNTLVEMHSWIAPTLSSPPTVGEIWGNFSLDGGHTWASSTGVFVDFAIRDPNTLTAYEQITDVSVTFDRTNRDKVYVVSSQHNPTNTSGAIVFERFTLDPVNGFTQTPDDAAIGERVLYRWFNGAAIKSDPAFHPYIAIDNNEPSYTDPVTGNVQTDTLATLIDDPFDPDPTHLIPKAVYVAWNVNQDERLGGGEQLVSDVMVAASADGGHNWSIQQNVSNNSPGTQFINASNPVMSFAQGTPVDPNDPGAVQRVQGGTMNVMYTDRASNARLFVDQMLPDGGVAANAPVAAQEFFSSGGTVFDAFSGGGPNNGDTPISTSFTMPVTIDAPAFAPFDQTLLNGLDVEINLVSPHTAHLLITLTDPLGNTYILLLNRLNNTGGTNNGGFNGGPVGVPDSNDLGVVTDPVGGKHAAGLVFDLNAPLNINDPLTAAPWVGHFQPERGNWSNLFGRPVSDLNGDWTLTITDFRNDGSNPPPQRLIGWSLHFTSNIDVNGTFTTPAIAGVGSAAGENFPGANPATGAIGVSPRAVIAYDNTLGSYSPFQGRLYVAYTSGSPANPNIGVVYSDDNGASWSQTFTVNDDNDDFSEGTRAQFMPTLAVDPVTGTVVVSYYDGRFDAAGLRLANSISESIDGGRSWSQSVFLNDIKTAGDFLTGQTINIEPIPGNEALNGVYGFGDRAGLVAYGGQAIPVFATNLDAGTSLIRSAVVEYAAGPRIVSGDMGPITTDATNPNNPDHFTYNNTFAADGTRQLNGFVINFDRPVDPSTVSPGDITVVYRDPNGNMIDISNQIQSITPLNLDQQHGAVDGSTQPTVSISDGIAKEGNTGFTPMTFTIALSQPQLFDVTVGFATQDGAALAGKDYVAKTGAVLIPAGQTTATITVSVIGDVIHENNEKFSVNLTSLSPGLKRDRDSGTGTIVDDDAVQTMTIGDAFVWEGNNGTTIMSFPVTLSIPDLNNPVGVNFATTPGTATAGGDYVTTTGTLIFNPGQTTAFINVTINGDTTPETNETLTVTLQNPTPNTVILARATATGTIADDDAVGMQPTVLVSDGIAKEGDSGTTAMTFTATLSSAQAIDVFVSYTTVDGSAVAGQDYVTATGQVKIPAGQTSATFTVNVKGDLITEGNELFTVNLSSATPGVVLARPSATGRIVDDDEAPTLSIGNAIIKEGDSGTSIISFPVILSVADMNNPVTVKYSTSDGSAIAAVAPLPGDYDSISNTLTFAPGQTVAFINVTVFGDILVEPGDENFFVALSNPVGATIRPGFGTGTGTIIEDDNIGTPATVSIGDAIVKEGDNGTTAMTFTVVLSQKQPNDVVITYATRNGTAVAGQDYVGKANQLVIPKETTSATFTISVIGDTLKEGNENFFVDLTGAPVGITAKRTTGVGTIVDDDGAPSITIGDATVQEGDSGTTVMSFPLALNVASTDTVTVNYTLVSPTGANSATLGADFDYASAIHTFSFAPGQTTGTINVNVFGDQVIESGNEHFLLNLSNAANASIARPQATGTIVDDDELALTVGDLMVTEGAGNAVLTVYLNSPTSKPVSFNWSTQDGTAVAGQDYTANANGSGSIAPGFMSTTITVPILTDTVEESLETFQVNLTNPVNAALLKGSATVSIVDDDQLPRVTLGDVTVRESDGIAHVPVYLSFPATAPITVGFTLTGGPVQPPFIDAAAVGTDYTVPGATVVIPAGNTQATIDIPIVDDKIAERTEQISVNLTTLTPNAAFSNKTTGRVVILDNDVNVTVSDVTAPEGNSGNTGFNFVFMLSSPSDTNTVLTVSTSNGSATSGSDYTAVSNQTVTIFAGQTSTIFTVNVTGDTNVEQNEDFFLTITGVTTGNVSLADPHSKITGHGTIIDDDNTGSTIWSIGDATIFEGNTGTTQMSFTIYAYPAPGAGAQIHYFAPAPQPNPQGNATPGQDYTSVVNGTATIVSATGTQTIVTIDITGDQLQEFNENFFVSLSTPNTGSITPTGTPGRLATGTIVDDDQQVMVFTDFAVREGNPGGPPNNAQVPVMLSNPGATFQPFDFQVQDGTATRPSDYFFNGLPFGFIPANQISTTVPVRIVGDLLDEGNENFTVSLRNPISNLIVAKPVGTVTIVDDDNLKVSIGDVAVKEGTGGSTNAVVPVFLNARTNQIVRVFYTTVAGSASDTTDFTPDTNFVDIPAGSLSANITVPITTDNFNEGNEDFQIQITGVQGAGLEKAIGDVTIVDDDMTPALSITPGFLREQNGTMSFTVYSSYAIASDIHMTVNTSDLLATAGADYDALTNFPLTLAAGTTSASFTVNIHDDAIVEGNENFLVTLSNADQGATFAVPSAQGTIVDNEPTVDINIGDAIVKEGDSGQTAVTIPIFLSGPVGNAITVHYKTVDDTATAPRDYVAIPDTVLIIPANTVSTSITVMVQGNGLPEGDHQFFVQLFNSVGANVAKPQATVTVVDDDSAFGATQFLIRIAPQSAVGTYSYAVGPDVRDRVQWIDYKNKPLVGPAPIIAGNKMDQNNNSIAGENDTVNAFHNDRFSVPTPTLDLPFQGPYDPDTLPLIIPGPRVVGTGFKTTGFTASTNTPIPAVGSGGSGILANDTGVSTLTVAGLTGLVADVNVHVNIGYPSSNDLILRLRAPNGQVILLAQKRGAGNAYTNTTFDDQSATPIGSASVPFGVVRPDSPLNVLNFLSADKVNGDWSLEVEDTNSASVGKIFDWSLTFTMTNAPTFNDNEFTKAGNEALPDLSNATVNPSGTVISNLNASGLTGWITDVNVHVSIDYPNSGDLTLILHAPNGDVVRLAQNNGDGNFFIDTLFDDQAALNINAQDPNGPFFNVHPFNNLSIFNGIQSALLNGNWQLEVRGAQGAPGGILKSWSLDIKTSEFTDNVVLNGTNNFVDVVFDRDMNSTTFTAADVLRMMGPAGAVGGPFTVSPVPGAPASMVNRAFRIGFPTQQLSGDYQITVGSNIQSAAGTLLDTNANVGVDILHGGSPATGALVAQTYAIGPPASPGVNPANSTATPLVVPAQSTVTATLQITDQFKIVQGPRGNTLLHIQLGMDINHTSDPSLTAVLIAPDGTQIRLFSNVSFSTITFDDFANANVTTGGLFGLGTLKPQIPLSRLQGMFTSGLWSLQITNGGQAPATLNSWSLRFPHYQSSSGLGESVADQFTTGFRIFTMDPTINLSSATWTAVGPAASNQYGSSGPVNAIAVDPSDPSGNTVYIGAASGGVWKTTNFLTTNPQGPTYVPLTDLGPSNSLNINTVAVIGRNLNPLTSVVLAGTGDTDTQAPGIGLLRSMDGGATWQVIDSIAQNFDANGNPLPLSSPLRDHLFVGSRVNKIVVDPSPLPNSNGQYAVYIAVAGGANAGVYRSLDTGKTWSLMRAGNATDLTLAPASGAANGTLQLLYAAFANDGVYYTTSASSTSSMIQMTGGLGKPNHIDGFYGTPIPVNAPPSTPSGNSSRILLATPAKTGDALTDTFYQNWLYALVIDPTGLLFNLYITKDRGDNWTNVVIPVSGNTVPPPQFPLPGFGVSTVDENVTGSSSILNLYPSFPRLGGNYEVALAIDPTNPNVVYLAGDITIKVDITTISDPWAVINGDHSDNVAAAANGATTGPISPFGFMTDSGIPQTPGGLNDPNTPQLDFVNMYRDPYNPFQTPSTFTYITSAPPPAPRTVWLNDGTDVRWSYFTGISDPFSQDNSAPFRTHVLVALPDPLTGRTRIIQGNDQGVFTGVDQLSGSTGSGTDMLNRGQGQIDVGIGPVTSTRGSRNGNLQIAQFVAGAVQPSTLAADVAGSLFYGMATNNGTPASSNDILRTGNLNWQTYDQTRFNDLIATAVDGNGSWIATDPTGGFDSIDPSTGTVIFDPNRIGTTYSYLWPDGINQANLQPTDFFVIDFPNTTPISRATGLLQPNNWPLDNNFFNGNYFDTRPFGRFAVNPLDPGAILISNPAGKVFRTAGPLDGFGILWSPIAQPANLDSTPAEALAFGSPPSNALNLDDFIYAGTNGGRVFVTTNGGGAWRNISAGLDGSAVLEVIPNPRRLTTGNNNEAYAITRNGIYWMQDSSSPTASWVNITGNIFSFTRPVFNNPNDLQAIMLPGQLTSIAIDWRYAIPDSPSNPNGPKHPVLYVGGNAGVFRSIDKGATWTLYPNAATNGAPQEGGFLPNVRVTDLNLNLGYLNPITGSTNRSASENVLMATTDGRGAFAIRLSDAGYSQFLVDFTSGPKVLGAQAVSPNPGSTLVGFKVVFNGLVDATTFSPADVTILGPNNQPISVLSITDISVVPPGGLNPHNLFFVAIPNQTASGNYKIKIGPLVADFGGDTMNQNGNNINGENPGDIFNGTVFFTPNTPPTISVIPDLPVTPNGQVSFTFSVNDAETPNQLTLQATSPGSGVSAGILFNGNPNPSTAVSTTPTITITGGAQIGSFPITVTVTDPNGLTASTSFNLFVDNPPILTTSPNPIPDVTDAHSQFPKPNYAQLSASDPDPGDVVTFVGQAFANANFTGPLAGFVQVNPTTGQVDITPAPSFVGTYYVQVGATDGHFPTLVNFKVTVTNQPPSLQPIGDIVDHRRNFPKDVTLVGTDPDPGEILSYFATAYEQVSFQATQIDQSLGLFQFKANYDFNKRHRKEKYLRGTGNLLYYILPNGQLFRYAAKPTNPKLIGVFIAQLTPDYWVNPALLWNAHPTVLGGFISVNANQAHISPSPGFLGTFVVVAGVTDGAASATQTYHVTVFNNPPVFTSAIGSVTAHHSDFPQARTLSGADPDPQDAGLLTYSATAYERISYRARQLDLQFGFTSNGKYMYNLRHRKEKYIKGLGNKLFFILPNGNLFRFTGTATVLKGVFIEALTPTYWANPALLWNSPNPTVLAGFVNVAGNTINFTPTNFMGTYFVEAFVTDGQLSAKQVVQVNVTNATPSLAPIGDVGIPHTVTSFQKTLGGSDPDPQDAGSLTYSAVAFDGMAYDARNLDQQFGFFSNGNYQTNKRGFNERYISGAGGKTFVIFPDGTLYRFTGTATAPFIQGGPHQNLIPLVTFNESFWQDPSKIWNAPPITPLSPSPVSVAGNVLTFNTPPVFKGRIYVQATVTDSGGASATQLFKVFISNNPPVLTGINDQTVAASGSAQTVDIPLTAGDADAIDNLSFLPTQAFTLSVLAFQLDQQFGLVNPGSNFFFNHNHLGEKWLRSAVNNSWFAILPNGEVHNVASLTAGGIGPVVATLDSDYWNNPALLFAAPNPGNVPTVTANVTGSQSTGFTLHLNIPAGYTGKFRVVLQLTDGIDTVSQTFLVNVQ